MAGKNGYPLTTAGYRIIEVNEDKKVKINKGAEKAHNRYKFIKGYNHSELSMIMQFARVGRIYQPKHVINLIKPLEEATNCVCLIASNKA